MDADPLVEVLAAVVGPDHVLVDPDLRASYETDWTRRFHGTARCVVRPGSTAEVAAVLAACNAAGARVVPQGGNTGLVGGSVPRGGEVILSLTRLSGIERLDPAMAEVVCGAGLTLGTLNEAAGAHGLRLGVDLPARDSATVGGMVATNAGGINVLRYGMMRAQLLGFEAVLADGAVIDRLDGPAKDNTGYDLAQLLAGSEGTLAVLTRLRLRLVPVLEHATVALAGFARTADAVTLALRARTHFEDLEAAEFFLPAGLELVLRHTGVARPFAQDWAAYVLLEVAGQQTGAFERLSAFLGDVLEAAPAGQLDAIVAADARDRERLWALRERHTEAINAEGVPVKLNVSLPVGRLPGFLDRVPGAIATACAAARPIIFGHIAEANLHVNILGAEEREEAVSDAVLRLVAELRGSISAEHGIGVAKAEWLTLTRSPEDIAAMRAIKQALDPAGILNPGVIFPLSPPAPPR